MNGLDDLRSTLGRHADDVTDLDAVGRRTAVHHRIGVAKRRRRVAVAGGAAAVVALVGGIALLPGDDSPTTGPSGPAGRQVFGRDIPQEITSVGFTYEHAESVTGDGRAVVRLPASDQPRLVSWGTADSDDSVTVTDAQGQSLVREADDFTDWVVVDTSEDAVVKATSSGDVALAVYTLGDDRPEGVTEAGLTFRQEMPGERLLAGTVGEPGQGDLTLDATETGPGTQLYYSCTGVEGDDLVVHHRVVGEPGEALGGISCDSPLPVDGTTGDATGWSTRAGEEISTRVWVTRGDDGPVVDDPDLRLAAALYALDIDPLTPEGTLRPVREVAGHTWALPDTPIARTRDGSLLGQAPAGRGVVLMVGSAETTGGGATIEQRIDGLASRSEYSGGSGGEFVEVVAPRTRMSLEIVEGEVEDTELAIGYYVRAD